MNIRIFWVHAMECMCAQTRPWFMLSSERFGGGMESEPMLTPREKSPLPEKVTSEEDQTQDTASNRTASPTHFQRAIPAPSMNHRQTMSGEDSIMSVDNRQGLFVGWLLNVPATCQCISGTDLLSQFDVLPHWDRRCRPSFLPHPVTVYWYRADQSQRWPYNARHLAG